MKHLVAALIISSIILPAAMAQTSNNGLKFKAERKRFEAARERTMNSTVTNEQWGYAVQIENNTFKKLDDVTVKYIVYAQEELPGDASGTTKEKTYPDSVKIGDFLNTQKYTFDTKGIDLSKRQLDSNWRYTTRAPTRSKASLTGIWIRVYAGGEQIAEYATPPSLARGEWTE